MHDKIHHRLLHSPLLSQYRLTTVGSAAERSGAQQLTSVKQFSLFSGGLLPQHSAVAIKKTLRNGCGAFPGDVTAPLEVAAS